MENSSFEEAAKRQDPRSIESKIEDILSKKRSVTSPSPILTASTAPQSRNVSIDKNLPFEDRFITNDLTIKDFETHWNGRRMPISKWRT